MELRHLRYFVAVAEELSFTKAARCLRLAQPSLTRQIKNLEEEIGVELFERANNRITLTEPGRRFLFDSKNLLAMAAENVAAVQRMKRNTTAQLRIGYVSNINYGILPKTLTAFRKRSPNVTLNLYDMSCAEQFQALNERRIDLGFVGLCPAHASQNLRFQCISHDAMVVAHPVEHPLSEKPRISLADLSPYFFIGMSASTQPGAKEWLSEVCFKGGFSAKILQEADEEMTAIKFVAAGLGVAVMPAQLTSLPHEGVQFRHLVPPLLRESTIAWRTDNRSTQLQTYIDIVRELVRDNEDK
ncbi:MAG TPA: LysR substrate-binding domain-containing protein [Candidatus Methylacidiphilales bacterium]|nr:LysR substrate-binding domain-containing protein [Candidatus Methylacidiphilales bacterium]